MGDYQSLTPGDNGLRGEWGPGSQSSVVGGTVGWLEATRGSTAAYASFNADVRLRGGDQLLLSGARKCNHGESDELYGGGGNSFFFIWSSFSFKILVRM